MSGVRAEAVWAAVWVAVVAVVATSVWLVISRAGAGVSSSETRFEGAAGGSSVGAPVASPSPSGTRTQNTPPTAEPSTGPTTSVPSTAPTAPAPPAAPVRRTASGSRGTITVECAGTAASLTGATPRSGAASEVEDSGPGRVRVEFEDDEGRTRIEATCAGGEPVFDVDDD